MSPQPIDATHALNLSAGVSNPSVLRGRSFVAGVINALQEHDEDLVDIISEMRRQKGEGRPINRRRLLEKVEVIGPEIDLDTLSDSISLEITDRLGSSWDEMYGSLSLFKELEGHCNVPRRFRTKDNVQLGAWVRTQRNNFEKTPPERRALLDDLGFVWDILAEAWNEGYAYLKAFKECEGHSHVFARFKTDDGFLLGRWVTRQRNNSEKILPEQKALLNGLGFVWDIQAETWNEGYTHLKVFWKAGVK